jgi:hypothetical protein
MGPSPHLGQDDRFDESRGLCLETIADGAAVVDGQAGEQPLDAHRVACVQVLCDFQRVLKFVGEN